MTWGKAKRCHWNSRRGLTTPVSTLIIFVSLSLTISSLYYIATVRVRAQRGDLTLTAAEEKMLELGNTIDSIVWSPLSSEVISFSNYGGSLSVEPGTRRLILNVTIDGSTYHLLNATTGSAVYKMASSKGSKSGSYLRGDDRTVVNRSTSVMSQIYFSLGDEGEELVIGYRPLASSSTGGLVDGKRVNNIRIYLLNLNTSEALSTSGEFHLGVQCEEVSSSLHTYNASSISHVSVTSTIEGSWDSVLIPVEIGPEGTQIRVEVVVCSVRLVGVGF